MDINETVKEKSVSLLPLATCHATQQSKDGIKSNWSIQLNETNEDLIEVSRLLNENEMFSLLDFMKKYELEAFNIGINFQKSKQNEVLVNTITEQKSIIDGLAKENERITDILDNLIGEQDE